MYIHTTHTYEYMKTDLDRRQFMQEVLASVSHGIRQEHDRTKYDDLQQEKKNKKSNVAPLLR